MTEAGRAMLPRVKRVLREVDALQAQAGGIASGLEPSLTLVVDSMFPMAPLTTALLAFRKRFPSVLTRLHVESLGAAADMIADGQADIGLVIALVARSNCSSGHRRVSSNWLPSARRRIPLPACKRIDPARSPAEVEDHLQLVLTDRSPRTRGQDHGIAAADTWRFADLEAKHAMLRAGLGWAITYLTNPR